MAACVVPWRQRCSGGRLLGEMAGAEPLIVGMRAEGPRRNAFVSKQVGTMSIERSAHLTIHRSVGSCLTGTFAAVGLALLGANLAWAQSQGPAVAKVVPLHAPDEKTIPGGPLGAAIRYGRC